MKSNFGILGVAFLLCVAFSSVDKSQSEPDYEAYLSTFFGLFNNHDWKALSNMYAEKAKFKDPALGPGIHIRTRSEFVEHYVALEEMIPDVQHSVINFHPCGNTVVVEFISTGTGPDGERFQLPICAILTIEDGFIARDYTYYDNF